MPRSGHRDPSIHRLETAGWAMAGPALAVAGAARWANWSRETILLSLAMAGAVGWIIAFASWWIGRRATGRPGPAEAERSG